jgi:hypothetical protein
MFFTFKSSSSFFFGVAFLRRPALGLVSASLCIMQIKEIAE